MIDEQNDSDLLVCVWRPRYHGLEHRQIVAACSTELESDVVQL